MQSIRKNARPLLDDFSITHEKEYGFSVLDQALFVRISGRILRIISFHEMGNLFL